MSEKACKRKGDALKKAYEGELKRKGTKNLNLAFDASYNYFFGRAYQDAAMMLKEITNEKGADDIRDSLDSLVKLLQENEKRRGALHLIFMRDNEIQSMFGFIVIALRQNKIEPPYDGKKIAKNQDILNAVSRLKTIVEKKHAALLDNTTIASFIDYSLRYPDEFLTAITIGRH